ncbi:MAG: S8 family peptidase [Chloroflexi bacterium]|nr:S8 family peptidase [Chloroflexota bacterium]
MNPRHVFPLRVPRIGLLAVVAIATVLGAVAIPSDGEMGTQAAGKATISPNVKIHPMLQYGAQMDPNTRVRVLAMRANDKTTGNKLAAKAGATVKQDLPAIKASAMDIIQKNVYKLADDPNVLYISPDGPVKETAIPTESLKTTFEQTVGVPQIWNGNAPATGKGVTVAVIDSGINASLPDFADATGTITCVDINKIAPCEDKNGHGTHVAGIISGRDPMGRYVGVAPDVNLVSIRIGNTDDGPRKSTELDLINALLWVYQNRAQYNIRVLNMSLSGSLAAVSGINPINLAVEVLWQSGITVVTSAGNRGTAKDATWYAPGNDPFVITVGALDENQTAGRTDDKLASFSSRGTTLDNVYKPDVIAPGRKMVSTLADPKSRIGQTFPDRITDGRYIRLSGTSMSAPVVTGLVALLLEKYPTLTPDQIKWLLAQTARAYPGKTDGAGEIDAVALFARAAQGNVQKANQSLTYPITFDVLTGTFTANPVWLQTYWDQTYWDQTYWDQTYWDQTYWDQTYWDAGTTLD